MALVKCPECGKQISDKSTHCIGCGCPMTFILRELRKEQAQNAETNKTANTAVHKTNVQPIAKSSGNVTKGKGVSYNKNSYKEDCFDEIEMNDYYKERSSYVDESEYANESGWFYSDDDEEDLPDGFHLWNGDNDDLF